MYFQLRYSDQEINTRDPFNENIRIEASSDCNPFHKRQRNEFASRFRQNLFGSKFVNVNFDDNLHSPHTETSSEDKMDERNFGSPLTDIESKNNDILEKMSKLLPTVIHEHSKVDKIDGLLNSMRLVKSGKFPLENIAFELFLDVVRWLNVENILITRLLFCTNTYLI